MDLPPFAISLKLTYDSIQSNRIRLTLVNVPDLTTIFTTYIPISKNKNNDLIPYNIFLSTFLPMDNNCSLTPQPMKHLMPSG